MTVLQAALLALVAGISHILPISASGHLTFLGIYFDLDLEPQDVLGMRIVFQLATALALLCWYRATAVRGARGLITDQAGERRHLGLLLLAAVFSGLVQYALHSSSLGAYDDLPKVALLLLMSAAALVLGECWRQRRTPKELSPLQVVTIGMLNGLGGLPGLSPVALSFGLGRIYGLSPRSALDISLLLLIPFLLLQSALSFVGVSQGWITFPSPSVMLMGFIASFLVSLGTLWLLRAMLARLRFGWFALYLALAAGAVCAYYYHGEQFFDPETIQFFLHRFGALFIFLFAFTEVVPPISFFSPGVFTMITAGALIADPITGVLFFLGALAGLTLGNTLLFFVGHFFGREIAHRLSLTQKRLHTVDRFMARFGRLSLFLGQFVGAVRPLIAFIAGTTQMKKSRFFASMILGSAVYGGSMLLLGFTLRAHLKLVLSAVGIGSIVLIAGAALFIVGAEGRIRRERAVPGA